jgi:exosome complex RNA-binding protein Rrp4
MDFLEATSDLVSEYNFCNINQEDLLEVTLRDLKYGIIEPGTIIWLDVLCKPCKVSITAVMLVVADRNGDTISLPLYN